MELEQTTVAAPEDSTDLSKTWLASRCPTCGTGLKWKIGATPEELERDGFTKGWTEDGRPNCPRCGTATELVERKPAYEAITEAAAAIAGTQLPLPIPAPPFDLRAALELIAERNRDVQHARENYDSLREETNAARKELDKESELLEKLIADLDARRRDAEDAATRPRLPLETCPYERETHQPCPICRSKPKEATGDTVSGHLDLNDLAALQDLILDEGQWVSQETITSWTLEERAIVEVWAKADPDDLTPRPRPAVLGTPHQAVEASATEQHCAICGGRLPQRDPDGGMFGLGQLVGTDCPGAPDEKPAA